MKVPHGPMWPLGEATDAFRPKKLADHGRLQRLGIFCCLFE